MWIRTFSEELLNLEKVSRFNMHTILNKVHILANYDTAQFSTTILITDSKEEAKAALEYIFKAIQNDVKILDSQTVLSQIRSK